MKRIFLVCTKPVHLNPFLFFLTILASHDHSRACFEWSDHGIIGRLQKSANVGGISRQEFVLPCPLLEERHEIVVEYIRTAK